MSNYEEDKEALTASLLALARHHLKYAYPWQEHLEVLTNVTLDGQPMGSFMIRVQQIDTEAANKMIDNIERGENPYGEKGDKKQWE